MVNDDNDKWADNQDLPINPLDSPEQLEKRSKGKVTDEKEPKVSMKEKLINNGQKLGKLEDQNIDNKTDDNKLEKLEKSKKLEKPKKLELEEQAITKSDIQEVIKLLRQIASGVIELQGISPYTYDDRGRDTIRRGRAHIFKYTNYYDVNKTITTAGPENPNDFDSPVYNAERIFQSLERYADIIEVVNDGTDTLFVIVSHGGTTNFSQEVPIFPGETKLYYNVYELRLRSPTAGLPYRITEYNIENVSQTSVIPIEKANLHNVPLPAVGTNWLSSDIVPTRTPTTFRIQVAVSTSGDFSAVITKSGNGQVVTFNVVPGPILIANGIYTFDLLVHSGDTINLRYSTTGANIQILRVQELDAAMA